MRRSERFLAFLLTAALTVTSVQMPVMASTVAEVTEVTEVSETADDVVVSEEVTEAAEVTDETTIQETDMTTEESTEADVDADSTVYVYSSKELVSALNGTLCRNDLDKAKFANKDITIELKDALNDDYDDEDSVDAIADSIQVAENKNITLRLMDHDISLSENVADTVSSESAYKYIKVPATTSLTILDEGSSSYDALLPFGIENAGTLTLGKGVGIYSQYGYALKNTGDATIDGAHLYAYKDTTRKIELPAVWNSGEKAELTINANSNLANSNTPQCEILRNEDGKVVINGGSIQNGGGSQSANAIVNKGAKAVLTQKCGTIESTNAYGIVNDGAKVYFPNHTNSSSTVEGRFAGIATFNGGETVIENEYIIISGQNKYGIIMTPYALEKYLNATSEGTVRMLNGIVEGKKAGIAYGTNLPVLVLGTVQDYNSVSPNAAVLKFVSDNQIERDVTKYAFTNYAGKTIGAYEYNDILKTNVALHVIENGLEDHYIDPRIISGNTVSTDKALLEAVNQGGVIIIDRSLSLSQNLVFTKDTTLQMNPNRTIDLYFNDGAKVVVNSGVTVNILGNDYSSSSFRFNSLSGNNVGVENNGVLNMTNLDLINAYRQESYGTILQNNGEANLFRLDIDSYEGGVSDNQMYLVKNAANAKMKLDEESNVYARNEYTTGIINQGELRLLNSAIYAPSNKTIGLVTEGKTIMDDADASIEVNTYYIAEAIAVLQKGGTFLLNDGTITCNSNVETSNAFVYTGDAVPTFVGGTVIGNNYNRSSSISQDNLVLGSAVIKQDGTAYKTGFYKNSTAADAQAIDSKNAWRIDHGQARRDSGVKGEYPYILLEKEEKIEDSKMLFTVGAAWTGEQNQYTISSNNSGVVRVDLVSGNFASTAVEVGCAILTYTNLTSGVKDYVRVEVVEKGMRKKLIGEDYTGSVLDSKINYNAYQTKETIHIDWHLKSSEKTASLQDDREVLGKTFSPTEVVINDKTFNRYFSYSNYKQDEYGSGYGSKLYSFDIVAKRAGYHDEYNLLVTEDVKELKDIEVYLKLYNEESKKNELISIGTFSIKVDQTVPGSKKADKVVLNSFYTQNVSYDTDPTTGDNYYYPNKQYITCSDKKYVINDWEFYDDEYTDFYRVENRVFYRGNAKTKKATLNAQVNYEGYNGDFIIKIPVEVIHQKPKANVTTPKVTVTSQVTEGVKIPFVISGKKPADVSTVMDVEVVDNKNFTVVDKRLRRQNNYINIIKSGKMYVHNSTSFYLQQNKDLTKAETVTLKVTYDNGDKLFNGKEYSTTMKIKVSPAKKLTIKQQGKAVLYKNSYLGQDGYRTYDSDYVALKITPENFKNGYIKVSDYDGKLAIEEPTLNGFRVAATKDTEALSAKTKVIKLPVTLYDMKGAILAKTVVKVNLSKDATLSANRTVTMDINKGLTLKKNPGNGQLSDVTLQSMGAKLPVKYLGFDWAVSSSSDKFYINANLDKKSVTIYPYSNALLSGAIQPGNTYPMTITFTNSLGMKYVENIDVVIKDIKKAKAYIMERNASGKENALTLYKKAPYMAANFLTYTIQPYYGMTVDKVEIVGNTNYEVKSIYSKGAYTNGEETWDEAKSAYNNYYSSYQAAKNGVWAICFKDNKMNASAKSGKITLKFTYTDGTTADVPVKVTVK